MSVFRDLMEEAATLGAARMGFLVDLQDYGEEDMTERWLCTVTGPIGEPLTDAKGRTGEEALRRVVERLHLALSCPPPDSE